MYPLIGLMKGWDSSSLFLGLSLEIFLMVLDYFLMLLGFLAWICFADGGIWNLAFSGVVCEEGFVEFCRCCILPRLGFCVGGFWSDVLILFVAAYVWVCGF